MLETVLYHSRKFEWKDGKPKIKYEGAVVDLVRELEIEAQERGLTLSRWQTNGAGNFVIERITWAVHEGLRPFQSRYVPEGSLSITLTCLEGKTERCQAYRELSKLLAQLRKREV